MDRCTASMFTSCDFYATMDTITHARLGREMGMLLTMRHPTQLQSFHMLTFGHDFRTMAFRLNLYAVQNDRLQNILLRRDIIFRSIVCTEDGPKLTRIPTI